MSKPFLTPSSEPASIDNTTQAATSNRFPLSPTAAGSNGVALSRWTRQRAQTEQATVFLGMRGTPRAFQPSNPVTIPAPRATQPVRHPSTLGLAPAGGIARRPGPFMADPPPSPSSSHPSSRTSSQANSGSPTSSEDQEIDVFQALWELPKALEDRPMDLLDALKTLPMASPKEPKAAPPEIRNAQSMSVLEAVTMEIPPALQLVLQRDRLFDAVRRGHVEKIQPLLKDVPPAVALARHFPAATPDRFIEDTWTPAQRHLPTYRTRLQTYLRHCRELAMCHRWVRDVLRQRTDANALFSRELQHVCDLLRTTSELRLENNAELISRAMQLALEQPALEQALAEQPFTSLQTLRDKCAILVHYRSANATLMAFDSVLQLALAMQHHAAEKLCAGLIAHRPPPPGSAPEAWSQRVDAFKSLWRMAFARQATALPHERIGHKVSTTERKEIHAYFLALHGILTDSNESSFDIAILKRLSAQAEGLVQKKSGQPYAETQDSDDE